MHRSSFYRDLLLTQKVFYQRFAAGACALDYLISSELLDGTFVDRTYEKFVPPIKLINPDFGFWNKIGFEAPQRRMTTDKHFWNFGPACGGVEN
jgi:hypothetical protein